MSTSVSQITPQAFKLKDAAAYLGGVSVDTVRRLEEKRILKRVPEIRHLLITRASLDRLLAQAEAPR